MSDDYGPVRFGTGVKVHFGMTTGGVALCGKSAYRNGLPTLMSEASYPLTCSVCLKMIENRPFWRGIYDRSASADQIEKRL